MFIKGHLFIENIFNILLSKKNITINTTFSDKINKLYDNGMIDKSMKSYLKSLNKIRNKIAHDLFYKLKFEEVYELLKLSHDASVDYSDDCIYQNKRLCSEFYGLQGIINELFTNTFSSLILFNSELFAEDEISKYLC